ncbi:MAG: YraN family protein [Marinicaulis sp.]|nr:YraN family protein [Marinicaulis sp.]
MSFQKRNDQTRKFAKKRETAEKRGRHAEIFAASILMLKGYRILAHRFRTPVGEIDLIAK